MDDFNANVQHQIYSSHTGQIMPLPARIKISRLEAGCDEVGRGCLAGPVVAAVVILPPHLKHENLVDSKKLSAQKRVQMSNFIKEKAIAWSIAELGSREIDDINILNASFKAMENAVKKLVIVPEHLLIDGNRFRTSLGIPFDCIVKGDAKVASIAAASILAKTFRDERMSQLHNDFPMYGWNTNMGYPTKAHREGIRQFGITPQHRQSFRLIPEQLSLSL